MAVGKQDPLKRKVFISTLCVESSDVGYKNQMNGKKCYEEKKSEKFVAEIIREIVG